jgi:hypothetical protein
MKRIQKLLCLFCMVGALTVIGCGGGSDTAGPKGGKDPAGKDVPKPEVKPLTPGGEIKEGPSLK